MLSLFFFSVSLLCSALSIKVETYYGANASRALEASPVEVTTTVSELEMRPAPLPSFALPVPDFTVSDDPRALLSEGETSFYAILKTTLAQTDFQVLAKVHLPALTRRADESIQTVTPLNRALAAHRSWEADFAICRGNSLVVVAVVRLRSSDDGVHETERANLEEALACTLAAARIPVVLIPEAPRYDHDEIAALVLPHLT